MRDNDLTADTPPSRDADQSLRELVERFDLMVRGSKAGLWDAAVNSDDAFNPDNPAFFSDRLQEIMGYKPGEMRCTLGGVLEHIHPDDRQRLLDELADHLYRGAPYETEHRIVTRSGEVRWVHARGDSLRDAQGRPTRISGSTIDITARKLSEERLLQEQDFLHRLLRAHERDGQLLAYEVHDGLVQDITAAVWHLDSIPPDRLLGEPADYENLAEALRLLRRALVDGRRLLYSLRPPILDEQGLVMAIKHLVAEQGDAGTQTEFHHDVHSARFDTLLEATMFRVVQEALSNVRNHSRSPQAEIELVERGQSLHLSIRDGGVGFDPERIAPERFGLRGARKRVALLNGDFNITSAPGTGTHITVRLPLTSTKLL
ncbi:MAG TPA: PAS domain-containing protein [Pirellulales bacterium]|jgi:PAS domain S-box-containing protein|nr:PAS domain-containing protein [Pirellulales bacterium]